MIKSGLSRLSSQERVQIGLLILFCSILYFLNLGEWDLWNPDEPRYAQVAREIVQGGDWILMHLNGATYADKPPLFFWLVALSSFLWQGFTSFSVRLPSAVFGTLTVVLTYLIGKRLYSSRTGFLSGLILATSIEFAYLSARANIDATLTFFTTAALFSFTHWYKNMSEGRPCFSIYGFYIGMALGTLTKGPVGLLIPLLVGLAYLVYQRDWQAIRKMRLPTGLLLFAAITLAWYLPAVVKGGTSYLQMTLLQHTVDRYVTGWRHVRPFHYYLWTFPGGFLPWSFFLPGAVAYGHCKEMAGKRKEFLFLLIWFIVIFVFFSLSKGKRGLYLLPVYPAAALLVGKLWDDLTGSHMEGFNRTWVSLPLWIQTGLLLVGSAAIPVGISLALPTYLFYSIPAAVALLAAGLGMLILLRRKQWVPILVILIGFMTAGFLYTFRVVFPLVDPYKSARFISQEAVSRIQPGEKMGIYGLTPGAYVFYTGILPIVELESVEDLAHFLQSSEQVYCFVDAKDLDRIKNKGKVPRFELIARREVGGSTVLLVSNQ